MTDQLQTQPVKTEPDALQGLTCPKCGGVVPIPEGQEIVQCPYCELRSVVSGERGIRRYQVPCRVERPQAEQALQKFLRSHWAIAFNAQRQAQLTEAFVAYLPFWASWASGLGWAFGEEKVGSGDNEHYEPIEVKIAEEMSWNNAACDVGEFGVTQIPLTDQKLEPFQAEVLHRTGFVFEPVNAVSDARRMAEDSYRAWIEKKAGLDRQSQLFFQLARERMGLVYYPLWILRYRYRGRAYQVAVDGYSGKVLYGKAPGNTFYRAAILVGGMALGAFLAIDIPSLILSTSRHNDKGDAFGFAAIIFIAGLGIMGGAYAKFRYGEEYEYRSIPTGSAAGAANPISHLVSKL